MQEKHYLKEEKNKLSQELSCIATENNKMTGELEILRSQDRRLKEKIANMEAALDKVALSSVTFFIPQTFLYYFLWREGTLREDIC